MYYEKPNFSIFNILKKSIQLLKKQMLTLLKTSINIEDIKITPDFPGFFIYSNILSNDAQKPIWQYLRF